MLRNQLCCLLSIALGAVATAALADRPSVGSTSVFLAKYAAFRSQQLSSQYPNTVTIHLGYVKGLSSAFSSAAGAVSLDLRSGAYSGDLKGLSRGASYSLWLVNQQQDSPVSELSDARLFKLADIKATTSAAHVAGRLDAARLTGFTLDRVVLSPAGESITEVIASGAMGVMQKIFFGGLDVMGSGLLSASLPFASLVPKVLSTSPQADAAATAAPESDGVSAMAAPPSVLISQGERLFFDGTFNGNGRTCGTCHPANNNFTIDPAFIATLPNNNPLFVAEFNPALAQLERPQLMRQFGLILENVDGLDNPTVKFVMRSVPHTLGMQQSLQRDTLLNGPVQMTGWSGDGAPGAGSLRDFAVGAVTQHFTKSLARQVGPDFNLPNNQQLDAMEAFQLSLGRATDFNLSAIAFQATGTSVDVQAGKLLFLNGTGDPNAGGTCQACHGNGGARATFVGANNENRNFNTNVEDRVNPARAVQNFPIDGGFGLTANPDGSFGNRTFNTPPVVEAADTAPFFHNNVVSTLEGVVQFYSGPEFNNPRAPAARFNFNATQTTNLANFMRALNTLQNIDVARGALLEILALNGNPQPEVQPRLQRALFDSNDAIRVLNQGGIYANAVAQLTGARNQITQAQATNNPNTRSVIIQQAVGTLAGARALIATP